ncbi:MAG TPA: zinc finger protein [bacterium]|nr:zinc finger protein [bacterium]
MAILEGRWDCASCGRKANMGHDLHCPGCGKPRGAVKFYLPPDAQEIADAEKLAEAKAGPDWVCAYCEASNRSTSAHCTGCGAERSEGKARVVGGGDANELTEEQRAEQDALARGQQIMASRAAASAARTRWYVRIGCLALLLVGSCVGTGGAFLAKAGGASGTGGPTFRFGAPSTGAWVTVTSREALRTIDVQQQQMVESGTWCSEVPMDAHVLSRESRRDGTRCEWRAPGTGPMPLAAVGGFFGTKDLGNGYFEKTEDHHSSSSGSSSDSQSNCRNIPVYRDWCRYEAMRWVTTRTLRAASDSAIPEWPAASLLPGEREGTRAEHLGYVVRTSDGEVIPMQAASAQAWSALEKDRRYAATFSMFGGLKSVGAPL